MMPAATPLLHPRLHQSLRRHFYPAACTLQAATETQDDSGHPVPAWSNLAEHVDLAARLSPLGGGERKNPAQVYAVATHVINLAGHYPAVTPKMRAVIAGTAYDILLVEHDGGDGAAAGASTRLVVELVR